MAKRAIAVSLAAAAILAVPAEGAAPGGAAAPIPDFSGYWGRNSVDPAPPPSGAGPVTNKTRTFYMRIGDDTNPILKPAAAEAVKKATAVSATGVNFATPSNQCWPMPPPYIWRSMGMQMLQRPSEVIILYTVDQYVGRVRIGGAHPARVTPSWYGDSIGLYEGGTHVIDTVGIKPGRYGMVDNYGSPQTEALHVVERVRLIDFEAAKQGMLRSEREGGRVEIEMGGASIDESYTGKGLQVTYTVEDSNVFTRPWSAEVTYRRALGGWGERICADNPHNYIDGTDTDVPRADRPDF